MTGGIGPTFDDMTVKALAKSIRQRMRVDPIAIAMIREHYSSKFPNKKIEMTKPRLKMATIPIKGNAVPNPVGTAPAVHVKVGKSEIFCLPGVPNEARAIFRNSISKQIQRKSKGTSFVEQWIRVTGIMESTLAPLVDQVMNRWPQLYIKSHPRGFDGKDTPNIELHISSFAFEREKAEVDIASATKFLGKKLRGLNDRVHIST
jgi:molybdopterin-biosynthesis enzyme MoeA-like protein